MLGFSVGLHAVMLKSECVCIEATLVKDYTIRLISGISLDPGFRSHQTSVYTLQ